MELKDVIHFYMGAECNFKAKRAKHWVRGTIGVVAIERFRNGMQLIPLLRKLNSITNEEALEFSRLPSEAEVLKYKRDKFALYISFRWKHPDKEFNLSDGYSYSETAFAFNRSHFNAIEFQCLLSKHFDLFNLIETKQANDIHF